MANRDHVTTCAETRTALSAKIVEGILGRDLDDLKDLHVELTKSCAAIINAESRTSSAVFDLTASDAREMVKSLARSAVEHHLFIGRKIDMDNDPFARLIKSLRSYVARQLIDRLKDVRVRPTYHGQS